jgi:hypothetical protein
MFEIKISKTAFQLPKTAKMIVLSLWIFEFVSDLGFSASNFVFYTD